VLDALVARVDQPGLAASLLARDGVTVEIHTHWGAPRADVLRDWVARFADEDLRTGLTRLRAPQSDRAT
jgi:hypothetical protein